VDVLSIFLHGTDLFLALVAAIRLANLNMPRTFVDFTVLSTTNGSLITGISIVTGS